MMICRSPLGDNMAGRRLAITWQVRGNETMFDLEQVALRKAEACVVIIIYYLQHWHVISIVIVVIILVVGLGIVVAFIHSFIHIHPSINQSSS